MKEKLRYIIGRCLVVLMPKKAAKLGENGMTIVLNKKLSKVEYLMRDAILNKAKKNKDFDNLAKLHHNYWVNKGDELFVETDDMFENIFLPDWSFIFDKLQIELAGSTYEYKTLVEIGAGNGNVLNFLSQKFPQIEQFIGIDLSVKQIAINKQRFHSNTRLSFVAADVLDWVNEFGEENTIFVTSGGVLEYFTQENLEAFLKRLNNLGKIKFIAIEPIGSQVNFETNSNSQIYGPESSFSHNYKKLFENAGFSIWHQSNVKQDNTEWYFTILGAKN
ncbi:class I SAM-dependent methyltransferase [Aurantibacter sp.]|uniref:class I SAM-dependent methyltransferase n=1 Tax=Aurantibacter sp. TaxID=2807103 RepID=UPI003267907B